MDETLASAHVAATKASAIAALGPAAAAAVGELYMGVLLGSIVHSTWRSCGRSGDPVAIDRTETWPSDAYPPRCWSPAGSRTAPA
ncbi:MAG: hypothetical protein R3C32_01905 [Chloroflexota bacterium]